MAYVLDELVMTMTAVSCFPELVALSPEIGQPTTSSYHDSPVMTPDSSAEFSCMYKSTKRGS